MGGGAWWWWAWGRSSGEGVWAEGGRWGEGQGGDGCSSSKGGGPMGRCEFVEAFAVAMLMLEVASSKVVNWI